LQRPLEPEQYTSLAFGRRLRQAGLVASVGSVGDAYDNAVTESFFATLECELLDRTRFTTRTQAGWPSSTTWRASTTPTAATPPSASAARPTTKGATKPPTLPPSPDPSTKPGQLHSRPGCMTTTTTGPTEPCTEGAPCSYSTTSPAHTPRPKLSAPEFSDRSGQRTLVGPEVGLRDDADQPVTLLHDQQSVELMLGQHLARRLLVLVGADRH
jgi:transposase InsO family protein